jgi:beta-galactosidase
MRSVTYKLKLPTSAGNITIPQLGGTLSIHGRDSKIHVTDYPAGDYNILYSSAEIFTWKKHGDRTTLVVYGGPNERHELAVSNTSGATAVEGFGIKFSNRNKNTILHWESKPDRRVVRIGSNLYIVILDRNSAYDYWTVSSDATKYSHELTPSSELIVKAGYLLRTASISGSTIHLKGDINATTTVEIVAGAHKGINGLTFNDDKLKANLDRNGFLKADIKFSAPKINLPSLNTLPWKSIDTLPELRADYDDSAWPDADHTETNNTYWPLTTPTVLWGAEYGFHAGSLVTRGHFVATGSESVLHLNVSGGSGFAFSAWVNSTFIGSWSGAGDVRIANLTLDVPKLSKGKNYVITVFTDNMGHNGNWNVGFNEMKTPRGIIGYSFPGHTPVTANGMYFSDNRSFPPSTFYTMAPIVAIHSILQDSHTSIETNTTPTRHIPRPRRHILENNRQPRRRRLPRFRPRPPQRRRSLYRKKRLPPPLRPNLVLETQLRSHLRALQTRHHVLHHYLRPRHPV